jgi:hypothetical protein
MRLNVADLGQVEAAPGAAARQSTGAAAGKLKEQYGLAAVLRVSQDMRAGGTGVAYPSGEDRGMA